jgi:hypothetical protein
MQKTTKRKNVNFKTKKMQKEISKKRQLNIDL